MSNATKVTLLRVKLLTKMGLIKRAVDLLLSAGALLAGAVRYVATLIQGR